MTLKGIETEKRDKPNQILLSAVRPERDQALVHFEVGSC